MRLLEGIRRRSKYWSWYGAGKTHSLYYLSNQALSRTNRPVRLIPVYTEFPKGARGFIDLYRAFMASFDTNLLLEAFLEFTTTSEGDRFYDKLRIQEPDFATTLRLLAMGDGLKQLIAQRWLRGDQLVASDLRPVGITQRISNTQQATRVFSTTTDFTTADTGSDRDRSRKTCRFSRHAWPHYATVAWRDFGADPGRDGAHAVRAGL
jgi:hypothetical protein